MSGVGKVFVAGALVLGALTLYWTYHAVTFTWSDKAEFDLLGFAWMFANFPGLLAVGMAVLFGGLTLYALAHSLRYR